jgi:hypothetical protein
MIWNVRADSIHEENNVIERRKEPCWSILRPRRTAGRTGTSFEYTLVGGAARAASMWWL